MYSVSSDHELFKSKGVAHALQRVNNAERSLSRASTMNSTNPVSNNRDEVSIPNYGRESVLFGQPISSVNQYSTSTPISSFGMTTGLTSQIENPITSLQEYCKANMLPIDIKAEVCELDPKNPTQRQL
jgi:hypothetical protein